MHAIYSKSAICVALNCPEQDAFNCTCDATTPSDAIDLAARLCASERNAKTQSKNPVTWAIEQAKLDLELRQLFAKYKDPEWYLGWLQALQNYMFSGSWFSRVWTFQEAVMPKKLYIQCGKNYHDWDNILGRMLMVTAGRGELFQTAVGVFSLIDRCRREYRERGIISLATVIRMIHMRSCRFEADRLFGVAAMCGFNTVVPYDPHTSVTELWTTVRKWAIAQGDANFVIMGACDLTSPGLGLTPQLWQGRNPREDMNTFTITSHCQHGIQLQGGITGRILQIMEQFRTPAIPVPEGSPATGLDPVSQFLNTHDEWRFPVIQGIPYPTDPIKEFAFRMRQILLREYIHTQMDPTKTTYIAPKKRGFFDRMAERFLKVDLKERDLIQECWPYLQATPIAVWSNTTYYTVITTYINPTTNKFMQALVLVSFSISELNLQTDYYIRLHDHHACPNGEGVVFELNPEADGHLLEDGSVCQMVHARAVGRCYGIVYVAEVDPGSDYAREGFRGQFEVGAKVAIG
ncbi:hypothetical protein HDV00_003588 [Rhizophlyctis rosea]|nr:hypothetical protein HDV00_003588 [Rhizophlyctis rosea]